MPDLQAHIAMSATTGMVSVIIPMRNEERHIVRCLQSLLEQTYFGEQYELIVVDGESSDRSVELVRQLSQSRPQIRLLSNPAAIVPIAMNLGIRSARGEIIVRADAHTVYPPNYIENCIKYLEMTGADNVGGPVITVPASQHFGAQLVAVILSNRFGVGNSQFRTGMYEGYVDTVPFGTFRKHLFSQIGFFDETLVRNQDNELNARIRAAGGRIYQTPALSTQYFPPDTFTKLVLQTYRNSQWHLFTLQRTRAALGVRHVVPACLFCVLGVLVVLSPVSTSARTALGLVLAIYFTAAIYFSIRAPRNVPAAVKIALPIAFLIFHLSYGLGTIAGLKFGARTPDASPIRP
jgi:cellulose synthase/poly-beta-1,6-N-acetylglucosamine synthase-like glycosyltransferase